MEEEGDLTINLNTGGESKGFLRKKIVGNRGQRIRARRAVKSQNQASTDDSDREISTGPVDSTSPLRKHGESPRRRSSHFVENLQSDQKSPESGPTTTVTHGPKPRVGPVISSLFNRNPAIPHLPKRNVKTIKEKVFSSGSFGDLDLHPFMVSNLEGKMGLKQTTSVQCRSIPVLMEEKDALIKSQTGSGKTLAYAIPVVETLQRLEPKVRRSDGPYAVILVPTRELAIQSYDTFQKLVQPFVWLVAGCIIGGEKRKAEKARLRKGINILVATPGRLLDHIENTNCLNFSRVRWLILDEADRLLDMGYEKAVAKIVNAMNERQEQDRQTVMLSATLSDGVERLAGITLNSPERISVSERDESMKSKPSDIENKLSNRKDVEEKSSAKERGVKDTFTLPERLQQHYVIVPCKLRLVTLAAFILSKIQYSPVSSKMIIFLSTQDSVEFHYKMFDRTLNPKAAPTTIDDYLNSDNEDGTDMTEDDADKKIHFFRLHGDMQQKERTRVYQEFSQCSSGVLFCTDVAARGLDLPKVRWIVQYSSPGGATEYIHRVGRTARAGSLGHSLLFLMPDEVNYIKTLNSQNISLTELSMMDILTTMELFVKDSPKSLNNKRGEPNGCEEAATFVQLGMEDLVQSDTDILQRSRKAYQSFVRGYATYPAHLKSIFHVKNLHLGHLAKSFALREAPKDVGVGFSKFIATEGTKRKKPNKMSFREDETAKDNPPRKKQKFLMSEFGSGSKSEDGRKPFSGPGVRKKKKAKS